MGLKWLYDEFERFVGTYDYGLDEVKAYVHPETWARLRHPSQGSILVGNTLILDPSLVSIEVEKNELIPQDQVIILPRELDDDDILHPLWFDGSV